LTLLHDVADDRTGCLYPEELACIERAVDSRRKEFSTGRWLAREGLSALGLPAGAIPCGSAREPLWPADVVGSLTHSASMCAAVIGLGRDYRGVGLDLELSAAPKADLADLIVSPTEPREYRLPVTLRLVFSAKESVYKCLYPIYSTFLDFQEIDIFFDRRKLTFSAVARNEKIASEVLAQGSGVFECSERGALTVFSLPADADTPAHVAGAGR
jgi:4'-phosphopantetheinyl transferase EntD